MSYPFHIASGGRFKVEVSSPIRTEREVGLPDIPPIAGDVKLVITGDEACKVEQNIKAFRRSGRNDFCGLDYFTSEPLSLSRKGDYVMEVSSKDNIEQFMRAGAMISLTRFEHPVESTLRYLLLDRISYGLILLSLVGLVFSTRQMKSPDVTS